MNYTKVIFKGTSILFISSIFTAFFGYLFRASIARSFSVYDYGLFYAILSLITLVIPFKDFGLSLTVTRFIPEFLVQKKHDKIKDSIFFLFIFQSIIYIVGLLLVFKFSSALAQDYFKDPRASSILIILMIAYFFSTIASVFNATYLGHKKISYFAFFQVVFSATLLITFFILNLYKSSLFNAVWAYFIAYVIMILLGFVAFLRVVPGILKHKFKLQTGLIKKLFSFSFFTFLGMLFKANFMSIGTILLTAFSSLESVAYFNIALPIGNLLKFLFKPLSVVLLPISSEINARNKQFINKSIHLLYKYLFILFFPIIIYSVFFSSQIIILLFGYKYVSASWSLVLMVVAFLLLSLIEINNNIMLGLNKPKQSSLVFLIILFTNVILSYILIPKYDFNGAAMSFAISMLLGFLFSLVVLRSFLIIKKQGHLFLKLFLIATLLYIFSNKLNTFLLESIIYVRFGLLILLGGLFYLASLFLLKILTLKEIQQLVKRII